MKEAEVKDPFPDFEPKTTGQALLKAAMLVANTVQEHSKSRAAYIESLSPAARKALLESEAADKRRREFEAFRSALGPFAAALAKRESWTIADFAHLLVGFKPGAGQSGLFKSKQELESDEIKATLQSCAGASLLPQSGNAQSPKALYRTADLLRVAAAKGLGRHTYIGALTGAARPSAPVAPAPTLPPATSTRPPLPPPAAPKAKEPIRTHDLPAAGLQARRNDELIRWRAQLKIARQFVAEKKGTEENGAIVLALRSADFNRTLRELHPEFADIDERTLRTDRTRRAPRIVLRRGRPKKAPESAAAEIGRE